MTSFPAQTPSPPYYAVIFSSCRTDADEAGYAAMAEQMMALASQQPGFLGLESVQNPDGSGITVSYWRDLESIEKWRENCDHRKAQQQGQKMWYRAYRLRVCFVKRESGYRAGSNPM